VTESNWNKSVLKRVFPGANIPPVRVDFGIVCLSICLSDWDKRITPVARGCYTTTWDGRSGGQRRGQDSNLRTSYPVTDLANPRFRPLSHLSGRMLEANWHP
jgi:hypothetical protein